MCLIISLVRGRSSKMKAVTGTVVGENTLVCMLHGRRKTPPWVPRPLPVEATKPVSAGYLRRPHVKQEFVLSTVMTVSRNGLLGCPRD